MQGAVTPDGLALFAAFVRLLPLVTGCNRPKADALQCLLNQR